ncbi:wall-associated receptor kinase 3-like [Zingiber officinale]|uniref:wall-associated receptor kinase 3-like n=1 Tax=Zingiber officinale TaxID=94328 RepID=UPI001C4AF9C6|nr:wall-associated receptor kinase 3-like [Zingiber officinale]
MTKKKKNEICMCLLLLLLLAISRADSSINSCTRRCGDVDIPFPFGIESDCFLPGFHVFCNHSKLYSAGNIQILNFSLVEPRATIIQKNAHVHPQKYNNSTGGVYISREMDLTGSPFFFSIRDNIFAAAGCNVVAFFSSSNTLFNTPNGRACVSLCNDTNYNIGVISGYSCSGADGCCRVTDIPLGMKQFTSYLIHDFAGFNGSTTQNSPCLFSSILDVHSFNGTSRWCDLYKRYRGQFPVAVVWSISNSSCEQAKLNPTTYACLSRNSHCLQTYRGYTCGCNDAYEGNPYIEDGCNAKGATRIIKIQFLR